MVVVVLDVFGMVVGLLSVEAELINILKENK